MGRIVQLVAWGDPFTITPSDTTNFSKNTSGGIYVGGAGDVVVILADGSTRTFSSAPAGAILPVVAVRVNSTNTTATDLIGLV